MLKTMTVRAAIAAILAGLSIAAHAIADSPKRVDIPAGDLRQALLQISEQFGTDLVYSPEQVQGIETRGARGELTTEQAVTKLLEGTPLELRTDPSGAMLIAPPAAPKEARRPSANASAPSRPLRSRLHLAQTDAPSPAREEGRGQDQADVGREETTEIVVTGTRIRGATSPSPVLEITNKYIQDSGYGDLGEVIRSIPQNYAGGQNPEVNLGAGGIANQNITGGSALNLRGLGPDATLTLLNGRRLSYGGFVQAIDISVIPVEALDRIEIVTDGASAIYGSDAVAGVANVILKRDYEGFSTAAQTGTSTRGGGDELQASITGGGNWGTGGFIAAYDYGNSDAIYADDRSFLEHMIDPNTVLPKEERHSGLISVHQDLGSLVIFSLDALHTQRRSDRVFGHATQMELDVSEGDIFAVSPTLEFRLPRSWTASVGGSYGEDRSHFDQQFFDLDSAQFARLQGCYCNQSQSFEIAGEGSIFDLPAGAARLALGSGYRRNEFQTSGVEGARSSRYLFAETFLPVVAPDQGIRGVHRLTATAALRHERYRNVGNVSTPKIGFVFEPTADLAVKASWGKSFKAPNLLQEFQASSINLFPAELLGASDFPANATALLVFGGNTNLEPERAESYSGTIVFHPAAVPDLTLEVSYYHIDYTDRVVQPIVDLTAAFAEPIYAQFLSFDPSPELQAEIIASSPQGLINQTESDYEPADVIAMVFDNYINVARETARGVDLAGSYRFSLAGGSAELIGSASWLRSQRQLSPAQPQVTTAGFIFNPPKFQARTGLVWTSGDLTLAGFVNYGGSLIDTQSSVERKTGDFTTADLNARYRIGGEQSLLSHLEFGLAVRNVFDEAPPTFEAIFDDVVNYDSTNHSAIGRFISVSVSKKWGTGKR